MFKNLPSTAFNRQNIRRDVLNLLRRRRRSEGQIVAVQTSTIKNGGRGVFCQQNIKAGTALCLYPGVYTPPLPCTGGSQGEDLYLAGSELENRAYIMNLPECGGHIDGDYDDTSIPGARENPSAIGQFVNHPSKANGQRPNVGVVSFMWSDIFKSFGHTSKVGDISGSTGTLLEEEVTGESFDDDCASEPLFEVPNVPRADGFPWFYDGTAGEIVYFPDNTGEKEMGPGSPSGCGATTSTGGALIYATTDLHKGDECYLDYSLQKPYPAWAKDWYEPVT